ncbi:MAG: PIN domain-containing protein [Chloroflexi bacterium]|nr:PIN domain-containing protein [Chloroflexota bacterium]
MMQRYVLDAWALVAFVESEEPAASRVKALLAAAEAGAAELRASVINLGEVYYRIGRKHGARLADETLAELRDLAMEIVSAHDDLVFAAAQLKMRHSISYADAFAAATAVAQRAILVTGDRDFTALADRVQIEWLARR